MDLSTYLQEFVEDWRYRIREWRHNRCLMTPLSVAVILCLLLFWIISLALKVPLIISSFLLSWGLQRFPFVIEFLYPTSLGRWFHLKLARIMQAKRHNSHHPSEHASHHSRTIEMRIQVTDRIFIHPLPQFLDNLGYLVVCLPADEAPENGVVYDPAIDKSLSSTKVSAREPYLQERDATPIVAFVVDCGDAGAVDDLVKSISRVHYGERLIQIQSILSTHKHHDHTAGNLALKKSHPSIERIFGGAVENVPGCNHPLINAELVPLPKTGDNDMNEVIEVEAIATPGHTRGSLAYCLRSKHMVALFTGDTLFSGGSGVAFESDLDQDVDEWQKNTSPSTFIKANSAKYAMERCFAEIMARCSHQEEMDHIAAESILMLPGHEYTVELLRRQWTMMSEACRWKNMAPSVFFETMSHFYVALHRRSLPQATGCLLAAPSTLRRELLINPVFRTLQRRGETVVQAIHFWHKHFAKVKVAELHNLPRGEARAAFGRQCGSQYPLSCSRTLSAFDVNRRAFMTVYSDEFDQLIRDLKAREVSVEVAAERLDAMGQALNFPTIGRRPVPDTLPSARAIFKGLVGLVLLGSAPAAMTLKDSKLMGIPAPAVSSSDRIIISRSRLVKVLHWLGFLKDGTYGKRLEKILGQLWKEATQYSNEMAALMQHAPGVSSTGISSISRTNQDGVELGSLKWVLFGVVENEKHRFARWCMPCTPQKERLPHPIDSVKMHVHSGELVRHDPKSCYLCISALGGTVDQFAWPVGANPYRERQASSSFSIPENIDTSEIEVSSGLVESLLQEA